MILLLKSILSSLVPVLLLGTFVWLLYVTILKPRILFYLLIFSFPFLVGFDLTRYTIVRLVFTPAKLFGIWAFMATIVYAARKGHKMFVPSAEFWLTVALFAAMLISFFFGGQGSSIWFFQTVSNAMYLMMVAYWASGEKFITQAKLTFVLAILFSALWAALFQSWPSGGGEVWSEDGRYQGTMLNANRVAAYATVAAPYALTLTLLYFQKNKRFMGLLMGAAFVILLYLLMLSASRGGFTAFSLMAVGLLYMFYRSTRKVSMVLVPALAIILIMTVYAPNVFRDRVQSSYVSKTSSEGFQEEQLGTRYYQYKLAWELFQKTPLLGVGPDNFRNEYHRRYVLSRPVHNFYLIILMDAGLVGLSIYLALLFVAIRHLWLVYRRIKDPYLKTHALSEVIIVGGTLVFGLAGTGPMDKQVILSLGFAIALSVLLREQDAREAREAKDEPSSQPPTLSIRKQNLAGFKNLAVKPSDRRKDP